MTATQKVRLQRLLDGTIGVEPATLRCTDWIERTKYVSTLDLSSAYHQIRLKESSRLITAFTVLGMRLFQFTCTPYGLSSAGASFQQLIDIMIGPEHEPYPFSHLDDTIIVTETFEEHVWWLEHVLIRVRQAG